MHSSGCKLPDFQGDGFCDDENNNAGCDFDGGDCCGLDVKKNFCSLCQCHNGTVGMLILSGKFGFFTRLFEKQIHYRQMKGNIFSQVELFLFSKNKVLPGIEFLLHSSFEQKKSVKQFLLGL